MQHAEFLALLQDVRATGGGHIAKCPAHDDTRASLSVGSGDGRILIHCHTGCTAGAIVEAMGLRLQDLFIDDLATPYTGPAATPRRVPLEKPRPTAWRGQYESMRVMALRNAARVGVLAERWGVAVGVLYDMGVGIDDAAFAFPMHNGEGELVGVRMYAPKDGRKWALTGSRNGLFMSVDSLPRDGEPIFICEGLSDTAAMLDAGIYAVGRPSCSSAPEYLLPIVTRRDVIIIADNDKPGRDGAEKLARAIRRHCRSIRMMCPQVGNDARAWRANGAVKADIVRQAMSRRKW